MTSGVAIRGTEDDRFVPPDARWAPILTTDPGPASRTVSESVAAILADTSASNVYIVDRVRASMLNSRPSSDEPRWRVYLYERLTHFARQGAGSGYPRGDTLNRAAALATALLGPRAPAPNVLPMDGGSVRMVWSMNGWYLELDVDNDDATFFADDIETGHSHTGRVSEARSLLRDIIAGLSA